jgi:hypothetical protein
VPTGLADLMVQDRQGRARRLGGYWEDGHALLIFLRHFGCTGCREHVTALSPLLFEFHRFGLTTVFVGNGPATYIDEFIAQLDLADRRVEVVTDPSLASFREADLVRSMWATLGPRAIVDKIRGRLTGHTQPGVFGDYSQQGGALLVAHGGELRLHHKNRSLGDHASNPEILHAALALMAEANPMPC